MSKKKKVVVDERDEQNKAVASQWALRVVILYTVLKIIYYLDFNDLDSLSFLLWDGLLLAAIGLTYFVVTRLRKTYHLPRTQREGKIVDGNQKESRRERMIKSYLPKALIFAAGWLLASTIRSGFMGLMVLAVQYLLYFIVTFLVVFAWGEWNVHSYNQSFDDN